MVAAIDSAARVRELVDEYWKLRDSMGVSHRRITRSTKVVHTRWVEIFRELLELRPDEHPLLVIEEVSGRRPA